MTLYIQSFLKVRLHKKGSPQFRSEGTAHHLNLGSSRNMDATSECLTQWLHTYAYN